MTTYTIQFTETEVLAMNYAAVSADEWIQNAAHERARISIEEIVQIAVQKFLENNQSIPGSREEIVAAAFKNGWVKSVADRNAERNQTIMPIL
jgi:hypothetical protein